MGKVRNYFQDLDDISNLAGRRLDELEKIIKKMDDEIKTLKITLKLIRLCDEDDIKNFIQGRIEKLQNAVKNAKQEIGNWLSIMSLSRVNREKRDREKTQAHKAKLRLEWKEEGGGKWFSKAGSVYRDDDKYTGYPICWQDRRSDVEDDRSYGHMVKKPSRDWLDQDSELIYFDTRIDCQLAVERAYFASLKNKKKTERHSK